MKLSGPLYVVSRLQMTANMPSVPNMSQVEHNDNFVAYRKANIHSKKGMTQLLQRRTYLRQMGNVYGIRTVD